jgi:hypothetical protein
MLLALPTEQDKMPIVRRKRPVIKEDLEPQDCGDGAATTTDQVATAHEPTLDSIAHSARPRSRAIKDETGKWQATGDYEVGFGRPPKATQFNGKPGPGRPKGTVSFDKLLRKHLTQKRNVRINGGERQVTNAELIIMTLVKDAVEGKDRGARKFALAEMARTLVPAEAGTRPLDQQHLNESDALSLAEFEQDLRERLLRELLESGPDAECNE